MNVEVYLWRNFYQKAPNSTVVLTKRFFLSGNNPQCKQIPEAQRRQSKFRSGSIQLNMLHFFEENSLTGSVQFA